MHFSTFQKLQVFMETVIMDSGTSHASVWPPCIISPIVPHGIRSQRQSLTARVPESFPETYFWIINCWDTGLGVWEWGRSNLPHPCFLIDFRDFGQTWGSNVLSPDAVQALWARCHYQARKENHICGQFILYNMNTTDHLIHISISGIWSRPHFPPCCRFGSSTIKTKRNK